MNSKIPVFLHVPRSGGTYLTNKIKSKFRLFLNRFCKKAPRIFEESFDTRFVLYKGKKLIVKTINVLEKNRTILSIFCTNRYSEFVDEEYETWSMSELEEKVGDLDIFSIMLEPRGISIQMLLLDKIKKEISNDFAIYAAIRQPEDRLISLFHYLTSENSAHEPTHKMFKSKTLEEFILHEADEASGSWLSSQISFPAEISDDIYINRVVPYLRKMKIFKLENIDSMLEEAFFDHYGLKEFHETSYLVMSEMNNNNKNFSDNYMNKNFELSDEAKKRIENITRFDKSIYDLAL